MAAASAVALLLVPLPQGRLIVIQAAPVRGLPPMFSPATKRTEQITAASIARMREKANPAIPTAHQVAAQPGMVPQDGAQGDLILTIGRLGPIVPVPVWPKSVDSLEDYKKSARLCVTIRIVLSMSSSYRLDAKSSRGRARIFLHRRVKL